MGILNVTPDSFSGDGLHGEPDQAVRRGRDMVEQGAAIIDVGGESTRPGHAPVSAAEEAERVLPVVSALVALGVTVSVDTRKAPVAQAAVRAGACIVNDVSAGADPDMLPMVADSTAHLVLVHGDRVPPGASAARAVTADLRRRMQSAIQFGIPRERLWVDPGLGFGKTWRTNLWIVRDLRELCYLGVPILVGPSRKRTIGRVLGGGPEDRLEGGLALAALSRMNGASVVRMHDVRAAVRALRMTDALSGVAAGE